MAVSRPYPYYNTGPTGPTGGSSYNINPGTSGYSPIFGGVPNPVGLPNPFADLSNTGLGLGRLNPAASADLSAQFSGMVSPGTQTMLQNLDAAQGVASGMPGSQLFRNKTLRDLGLTSESQINNAFSNYSKLIPAVSGTQTVPPGLQANIAARNATMASAPNPARAQSYAQQLFDQYLQMLKGPAGGTTSTATSPAGGSGAALGFGFNTLGPGTTGTGSTQIPYSGDPGLSQPLDFNDLPSIDPFAGLV